MKVCINDECTGCELCVDTCPEIFEMSGDVAVAKVTDVPADKEDCVRDAADGCPVEAIEVE
jgi:ferredoxin